MPVAALWDMDGTIVDTEPFWVDAQIALAAEFGGIWTFADAMECVGQTLENSAKIMQRVGVDMSVEDIIERLTNDVMTRLEGPDVPFRPGARELLAEFAAAGIPQALVTMSYRRMALLVASLLPHDTFATVVAGDDVERGKPFPDAYLQAAATLGVDPTQAVAFEDSPTGVRAAVASGAFTIGVPHMVSLDGLGAQHLEPTLEGTTIEHIRSIQERFNK